MTPFAAGGYISCYIGWQADIAVMVRPPSSMEFFRFPAPTPTPTATRNRDGNGCPGRAPPRPRPTPIRARSRSAERSTATARATSLDIFRPCTLPAPALIAPPAGSKIMS
jgi:hypothetical protein